MPGAMAVCDGKLYVGLCQIDPKWMPLHKEVELALIDIATDKVEKKISSGGKTYSSPTTARSLETPEHSHKRLAIRFVESRAERSLDG